MAGILASTGESHASDVLGGRCRGGRSLGLHLCTSGGRFASGTSARCWRGICDWPSPRHESLGLLDLIHNLICSAPTSGRCWSTSTARSTRPSSRRTCNSSLGRPSRPPTSPTRIPFESIDRTRRKLRAIGIFHPAALGISSRTGTNVCSSSGSKQRLERAPINSADTPELPAASYQDTYRMLTVAIYGFEYTIVAMTTTITSAANATATKRGMEGLLRPVGSC